MTPYVVNSTCKTAAAATSITSTSLGQTTAGDAILVFVETATDPTAIAISADSGSNTWTQVGTLYNWSGTKRLACFVATNIVANAAHTVTAQFNSGGTSCVAAIMAIEIAGGLLLAASIADNTARATGASNAPASGNVTLTNANELVITAFSTTTTVAGLVVPPGYTALSSLGTVGASAESLEGAWSNVTTSPANPTWTVTGSPTWGCQTVSLLFQNLPTIAFATSGGSDTAASGAGPGTALTGTAAATNSNKTVNITDAVDLSGVLKDGSAVLWISAPTSGRQYSRIVNVTGTSGAWVVTTQDSYANSETKSWAIGGKRLKLDTASSRVLLTADAKGGWTLSFADTTAASLTTSAIVGNVSGDNIYGPIVLAGTSEGIAMDQSGSANHFSSAGAANPNMWFGKNLKFTNSNITKTNAVAFNMSGGNFEFQTCIFGDSTNRLFSGLRRAANTPTFKTVDCAFVQMNASGAIAIAIGGAGTITTFGCYFSNNDTHIQLNSGSSFSDCIFDTCAVNAILGFSNPANSAISITDCTFYGCTLIAIDLSSGLCLQLSILGCIFDTNGTAIKTHPAQQFDQLSIDYNTYHSNTTNVVNISQGAHDQVGVDPQFTNAASHNFGVGSNMKAKGFPDSTRNIGANQSATVSYVDEGAAQHQDSGGGGLIGSSFTSKTIQGAGVI